MKKAQVSVDELCSVCNEEDKGDRDLIFCDQCNRAAHLQCSDLVDTAVPGLWFCQSCSAQPPVEPELESSSSDDEEDNAAIEDVPAKEVVEKEVAEEKN